MSRWSYAFPKISSSVCGGLDMAPALPPSCLSARPRRAASAACPSRLLIWSGPRASTWPPHSPLPASQRARGAPPLRPVLPGCSSGQAHAPRHGPRTPPFLPLSAPAARRLCGLSFPVAHLVRPTRLDIAPALPPPCSSARRRPAASALDTSRLVISSFLPAVDYSLASSCSIC